MPYLNFTLHRLAYNDTERTNEPVWKSFDFNTKESSIPVSSPVAKTKTIQPGSETVLDSTTRTLSYDSSSEFKFFKVYTNSAVSGMRNTAGTHPGFRTYRATSQAANTEIKLTRTSTNTMTLEYVSGTQPNFSDVIIGDEIYFQPDLGLPAHYSGEVFQIRNVTTTSVSFRDNGALPEVASYTLATQPLNVFRIFSQEGVKEGDFLRFTPSATLAPDNSGYAFRITKVIDNEIQFMNPYLYPETTILGANSFVIFDRLISFVAIDAYGEIELKFDDSVDNIKLAKYKNDKAFFAGTISATKITAINNTDYPVDVIMHSCSF